MKVKPTVKFNPTRINLFLKAYTEEKVKIQSLEEGILAYLSAMQQRYKRYALGAGNWEPIKDSTAKERFKRFGNPNRDILFNTMTLYNSLSPTMDRVPGRNIQVRGDSEVVLDFDTTDIHPFTGGQSSGKNGERGGSTRNMYSGPVRTIGEIFRGHQYGVGSRGKFGRLPARPILVYPVADEVENIKEAAGKTWLQKTKDIVGRVFRFFRGKGN